MDMQRKVETSKAEIQRITSELRPLEVSKPSVIYHVFSSVC